MIDALDIVFDIVKYARVIRDNNPGLSVADAVEVATDKALETASVELVTTSDLETARKYITNNYHVIVAMYDRIMRNKGLTDEPNR